MATTIQNNEQVIEEDSVVYVFDRRKGSVPERKIGLGGVFGFQDFKDLIKKEFSISDTTQFVIATTNREEINTDDTYVDLVDDGDTVYLLQHIKQALAAPAQERVEYQPHFDTLIRSGIYEYYASEGQNPLPFAFAELIDNSLAATADNEGPRVIEIRLYIEDTAEKSMVCVLDNGKGMTPKELNNWAIYRLSKFNRKKKKHVNDEDATERDEKADVPRSLNSDISYFGVGGKQAVFFIGNSIRMITKSKGSRDVHELLVSKDEFEKREKHRQDIYRGFIYNRQVSDSGHVASEDENLQSLIQEESGKDSFTYAIITGIRPQHIKFLKEDFTGWSRQLAHIYHYYIHGPQGNQPHQTGCTNWRTPSPFNNIDISITMYKKGHTPRQHNLRDTPDDLQSQFIQSSKDTFEFRVVIEGTGLVEGVLRYHPFLFDRETYPTDPCLGLVENDELEESDQNSKDRPSRGNRPIFECYWNGRLIPYTLVNEFDWCGVPKKRGHIPLECYNRISGTLFANSKFEVSTNKLTFIDLEVKLRDKAAVFQRVIGGQPQRVKIDRQFTEWLQECHEAHDKQVCFRDYMGVIMRPDLPKRQQGPWAVFETIEWDGKTFNTGQLVRTQRTVPVMYGCIQRFLLYGDLENEIENGALFATGGEFELTQEPRLLYNESKMFPLSKLDRQAEDRQIKKYITDEEGKLPEVLVISWPEANEVHSGEKRPAGKLIGAIKAEIHNRKGQPISRLPGSQHNSKKLLVELKIIWHSTSGDQVIVTHMSQHHKTWAFWFRQMDIVRNLGHYTLMLQTVLGEEGATDFGGRPLPNHKIKFTCTEGPPSKFSVGIMDPPFRVDVPFSIPLQLHDEFNHSTKATTNLKPVLQASGLELNYEKVEAKGTTLLVKGVKASGDVGSAQGKNYSLTVTIPGLEIPTQHLKIRLLPGEPYKIIVPTFEQKEALSIENGSALTVTVEIKDRAGNLAMHPKLTVICKFLGVSGLPEYSADCSNSGKATMTGNIIFIRNIPKKSQKISARVELLHHKSVGCVEKTIIVRPSSSPCKVNVFYHQHPWNKDHKKKPVKMKPQEEIEWTAGQHTEGITFALFDEGDNHVRMTSELASKLRFNWLPSFDPQNLLEGNLPPIKVPNTVGDAKFCQMTSTDGSGLEFSFYVKPVSGEPTQIKCIHKGNKKLRLRETLDGEIVVHVTDAFGNSMKKLPHGSIGSLEVAAPDLDVKTLQKALMPNVGFVLRNVRFEGSTIGVRELLVKYNDFTDHVRLELVAGRPSKLAVTGWVPEEVLLTYCGAEVTRALGFQVLDDAGNVVPDINGSMCLQHDKNLQVSSNKPLSAKPDSNGEVSFGKLKLNAPCGKYSLWAKLTYGRVTLQSSALSVQLSPDPAKPDKIKVTYKKKNAYTAGELMPDFDVCIEAEDGSTMTGIQPKNVSMRLWKSLSCDYTGIPPDKALVSHVDKAGKGDEEGHFYFRKRNLPQQARTHLIVFQAAIANRVLYSDLVILNIHPGPPVKLIPEITPPTPTVSNTPKSLNSRTLIQSLKLQLVDAHGNVTGHNASGTLEVKVKGNDNNGMEVPTLQDNKTCVTFPFTKGMVLAQNVSIQENSAGQDGHEYCLQFSVGVKGVQVQPYIQPFLFYNNVKKQQRMAQLSQERDTLKKTIRQLHDILDGKAQLLQMFKDSAEDASRHEAKLRGELRQCGLRANQIATVEGVEETLKSVRERMEGLKEKPRRRCKIPRYDTHDKDILGKVAHLAEVEDENEAYVLSWHMASDMDCVLTTTVAKSKEVFAQTNGRQQVLPIESIYRKGLTEWDKPLPHKRVPLKSGVKPSGNPVYARHLLKFANHEDHCRTAFTLLLQDTILLDNLDDATAYRQMIVRYIHCPTILTRDGNRIRGNGKFGGLQNRCPADLRGFVFGQPPPMELMGLEKQVDLLEQLCQACKSREGAQQEYRVQEAAFKAPAMTDKRRECQEAEEELARINQKLRAAESSATHHNSIAMSKLCTTPSPKSQSASRGAVRRGAGAVSESPRSKRRKP